MARMNAVAPACSIYGRHGLSRKALAEDPMELKVAEASLSAHQHGRRAARGIARPSTALAVLLLGLIPVAAFNPAGRHVPVGNPILASLRPKHVHKQTSSGRKTSLVRSIADLTDVRVEGSGIKVEDFSSWKLVDLKAKCKGFGLKVSGRKAELIARLEGHATVPQAVKEVTSAVPTEENTSSEKDNTNVDGLTNKDTGNDFKGMVGNVPLEEDISAERERLVTLLRIGQRRSKFFKRTWESFCADIGSGCFDASTHDYETLKAFLADEKRAADVERWAAEAEASKVQQTKKSKKLRSKDSLTSLRPGIPIELMSNKQVKFGNYLQQKPESQALQVRLSTGEEVTIDAGQIISVWEGLADKTPPETVEDWERIERYSATLSNRYSTFKKSDLTHFYRTVNDYRRRRTINSLDLGMYLFTKGKWSPEDRDKKASEFMIDAGMRYHAALRLFADNVQFKRAITELEPELDNEGLLQISEGGYKVLEWDMVQFRQGEAFAEYVEAVRNGNGTGFRTSSVSNMLRGLEFYAKSGESTHPPAHIRHLLKKFDLDESPAGAVKLIHLATGVQSKAQASDELNPVAPFSSEALEASKLLAAEVTKWRQLLAAEESRPAGQSGSQERLDNRGRVDFRGSTHRPMCIDAAAARLFDDAFSVSPETNEIFVHVTDVAGALEGHDLLQQVAKERVKSIYLLKGQVNMLPYPAVLSLGLSKELPNEVITVGLKLDAVTGTLQSSRVFPSIIDPVVSLTEKKAADILSMKPGETMAWTPDAVIEDMHWIHTTVQRVMKQHPWVQGRLHGSKHSVTYGKDSGTLVMEAIAESVLDARTIANILLTLYGHAASSFCDVSGMASLVARSNRGSDGQTVCRFASTPLRDWLSIMQQHQIRAAMGMAIPLNGRQSRDALFHVNEAMRSTFARKFESQAKSQLPYEALESHCAQMQRLGHKDVLLDAEATGEGGEVNIIDFGVLSYVKSKNLGEGQIVKVRVMYVRPRERRVALELCSE